MPAPDDRLAISEEVAGALATGRPVVALESSLLAHGLPAPHNLETARAAEDAVRQAGATPATTALDGGRIVVGADAGLLERLGDPGSGAAKAGAADIGPYLAAGRLAATTVSAGLRIAHLAGIGILATGGIGGVHRAEAGRALDVSADIDELAVSPLAVLCSGAKAILDLPATLELLESRRVPVIGLGVDELPAFYATSSGLALTHRVDSPAQAAAVVAAHRRLPGSGGILLVQPPPAEQALDGTDVEGWIRRALADAAAEGLRGGEVTPFVLARVAEASGGRTLVANTALIVANARTAAAMAVALAALEPAGPSRS